MMMPDVSVNRKIAALYTKADEVVTHTANEDNMHNTLW